jgi:hypothetical protein
MESNRKKERETGLGGGGVVEAAAELQRTASRGLLPTGEP